VNRGLYFFEYVNRKAPDIVAIVDSRALDVFQSATDSAVDKTAQRSGRSPSGVTNKRPRA
jgi:hypothetical protein